MQPQLRATHLQAIHVGEDALVVVHTGFAHVPPVVGKHLLHLHVQDGSAHHDGPGDEHVHHVEADAPPPVRVVVRLRVPLVLRDTMLPDLVALHPLLGCGGEGAVVDHLVEVQHEGERHRVQEEVLVGCRRDEPAAPDPPAQDCDAELRQEDGQENHGLQLHRASLHRKPTPLRVEDRERPPGLRGLHATPGVHVPNGLVHVDDDEAAPDCEEDEAETRVR
mmetsp:Transcript_55025/g.119959  ORF Transcript_55025/g.119959 Transcript_55025/m.119959 type:complete len:221 (+) Transcript_55025:140-802(+)